MPSVKKMQDIISENTAQYIIKQKWLSFLDPTFQISDKAGKILFLFKGRWNRHIFQDTAGNEIFIIKHRSLFKFAWWDFEVYSHNELRAIIKNTRRWFFSTRDFVVTLTAEREEMIVKYQSESFFTSKYIFSRRHEDVAVLSSLRPFRKEKYFINIREGQGDTFILAIAMGIIFVRLEAEKGSHLFI